MVSRSCTSRSSRCSAFSSSGSSSSVWTSASASTPSGSQRSRSTMRSTTASRSLRRLLDQALAAHAALARAGQLGLGLLRPCRPRPSRVSPTARRSAASWRLCSALAISSPSASRLASISAGLASSSARDRSDLLAPRIELDDLAIGIGQALAPAAHDPGAIWPSRSTPHRGLARQTMRRSPSASTSARPQFGDAQRAARRPRRGRPGCRRSTTGGPGGRCGASRPRRRRPRSRPRLLGGAGACATWLGAARHLGMMVARLGCQHARPRRSSVCAVRSAVRVASPASWVLRRAASATCALVRPRLLDAELLGLARGGEPAPLRRRPCALASACSLDDAVDLLADIGEAVALAEPHRRASTARRRAWCSRPSATPRLRR